VPREGKNKQEMEGYHPKCTKRTTPTTYKAKQRGQSNKNNTTKSENKN
jgi:hypothetical protein